MIRRTQSQLKGAPATFLAFAFVLVLWAAAIPMFGTPDEPAHMVRAAGIVRGQLWGEPAEKGFPVFEVPAVFDNDATCYAFKADVTASCLDIQDVGGERLVPSPASSYPPGFHAIIGLPTLVADGQTALYLMRLASAAICALFFTIALRITSRLDGNGAATLGLAVSLTPMVLFLSGAVNPSGVAAATGLTIWAAGLKLGEPTVGRPAAGLIAALGSATCVLLFTRRDSALWLAAIAIVLLISTGRTRLFELARIRQLQAWGVISVGIASSQFLLFSRNLATSFVTAPTEDGSGATAFGFMVLYIRELIGILGWRDTPMHAMVYYGWWWAFGIVLFAALVLANRRDTVAVLASIALFVGLITAIGSMRFSYFQPRYTLAFSIGIPLLAAHVAGKRLKAMQLPPRLVGVSVFWLFGLHQLAYWQHLRRYAVGVNGPIDIISAPDWQPTVAPIWALLLLYFIASGFLTLVLAHSALSHQDLGRRTNESGQPEQVDGPPPQPAMAKSD